MRETAPPRHRAAARESDPLEIMYTANHLKPIRRRMYESCVCKVVARRFFDKPLARHDAVDSGAALGAMGSPSKCQRSEWDRMALYVHCGAQRCGIPNKPNSRNT